MAKRFVLGDIHGAYRALLQCLSRAGFNYKTDILICLGDVSDGWPEVCHSIRELLKIKHLVYILGNHDEWTLNWFLTGESPDIWVNQGGRATMDSYQCAIPSSHIRLLQTARIYYVLDNKIFVHGGFNPKIDISLQEQESVVWDRSLLHIAMEMQDAGIEKITDYDEIYLGHTPTVNFGHSAPLKICEVYLMDTGAGWRGGFLSLMNIDTKEIYTSDQVDTLYPGYFGRG